MNQDETTIQSKEPVKDQGWIIEFDPSLEVAFDDEEDLDCELEL